MPRKIIPEKVEEAKAKIISAALDVIINEGFVKFSLSKVANKAGITKAAIYWYFPSKEELLNEITNSLRTTFISCAKQVAELPISSEQKIKALITSLEDNDTHKGCFLPIKIFIELYSVDHEIKKTIKNSYTEYIEILHGIFEQAIMNGEIDSSFSALTLAKYMMAFLDGCIIQDEMSGSPHIDYKDVYIFFMSLFSKSGGNK